MLSEIIKLISNLNRAQKAGFYFDAEIIDNIKHNGTHKIILKFGSSRLDFNKQYSFPLNSANFINGDFNAWLESVSEEMEKIYKEK